METFLLAVDSVYGLIFVAAAVLAALQTQRDIRLARVLVIVGAILMAIRWGAWAALATESGWMTRGAVGALIGAALLILAPGAIHWLSERLKSEEAAKPTTQQVAQPSIIDGTRAYVYVDDISITGLDDPRGPETYIRIKNSGQSPAYGVTHVNAYTIYPYPHTNALPPAAAAPDSQPSKFDLASGVTSFKTKRHRPIDQITGAGLAHGSRVLYFYGEILYTDRFKQPHFTRYKYVLGCPFAGRGLIFSVVPDGNESD
jgi:hypothetical protein